MRLQYLAGVRWRVTEEGGAEVSSVSGTMKTIGSTEFEFKCFKCRGIEDVDTVDEDGDPSRAEGPCARAAYSNGCGPMRDHLQQRLLRGRVEEKSFVGVNTGNARMLGCWSLALSARRWYKMQGALSEFNQRTRAHVRHNTHPRRPPSRLVLYFQRGCLLQNPSGCSTPNRKK
ncbi:hypothetical protein BKA93DRAFT_795532 [Sparassis latifolia]